MKIKPRSHYKGMNNKLRCPLITRMPSLEEKIKKDLEKTGFPTEIKVNRILVNRKWAVHNQYPFLDEVENKLRSVDFKATFDILDDKEQLEEKAECELFIECKKSERSYWVFYTEPNPYPQINLLARRLSRDVFDTVISMYSKEDNKPQAKGLAKITGFHQHLKSKKAYAYQIAFKGKDSFYEAQNQVLKSIQYSPPIPLEDKRKILIFPVIVFDGKMFECNLIDDELEILQIECVTYLSNGLPEDPLPAFIDVMTLDYFSEYLKLVEDETKELIDELRQ